MADKQYNMRLWMSAEMDRNVDDNSLRTIRNSIEKEINDYLSSIGYRNVLEEWWLVIILRDDDVADEEVRKERGKDIIGMNFKIPYGEFRDGDENKRKALIYDVILRSLDILERRKIKGLDVIRDFVEKKKGSCRTPSSAINLAGSSPVRGISHSPR